MISYLVEIKDYFIEQAMLHEVDPLLFGCLYMLSKISLVLFVAWVIKNLRQNKPFLLPLLFAALGYSLPYLYLIIAGKDIPVWIYIAIGLIYLFSGWSISRKIRYAQTA